jgi:hypothetical protein
MSPRKRDLLLKWKGQGLRAFIKSLICIIRTTGCTILLSIYFRINDGMDLREVEGGYGDWGGHL